MRKHVLSLIAALCMFAVLILPATAEISLSVESISMSNRGKTVFIDMTFTCDFAGDYEISGWLFQKSGRSQNSGYSLDSSGYCQEGEHITVNLGFPTQPNLAFKPGPAQLDAAVYLYGEDDVSWDSGSLNTVVRLKK